MKGAWHIDFETRSACDLIKAGSDVYSQDPSTEVLCMAFCFEDGPIRLWTPQENNLNELNPLLIAVEKGATIIGHNVGGFEFPIWNNVCTLKYGWPELKIEQCVDTMAMAYAMALPGSLDNASKAAGIQYTKDMKGHRIMLQLSQPRKRNKDGSVIWWEKEDVPEKFEHLYTYCIQDVLVEKELSKRLLPLKANEQNLWVLDHKINRRGVRVDIDSAKKALKLVDLQKEVADKEIRRISKGAVTTCNSVGQISDFLKYRGIEVESLAKADVLELLSQEIPKDCREVLELRKETAKTSTAKIKAMIKGVGLDGRMKGLFQWHGAGTGRWAGRRVQLQNLPRPMIDQWQIEWVFSALKRDSIHDVLEEIELFHGKPLSVLSDCLRGFLCAAEGHDFIGCDFSAIEARVLAWLAGEDRVLNVFKGNGKIYEHEASGIYNVTVDAVTKEQRQIGKVATLALGYQGGVGAFQSMAVVYGVHVEDALAEEIKVKWRALNPNIVQFWWDIEEAALGAVKYKKQTSAGNKYAQVQFTVNGSFLWCRLPSGRVLCYPYPKLTTVKLIKDAETKRVRKYNDEKDQDRTDYFEKEALSYMSVDSYTKKWTRIQTYGGKLTENVTQAVARDLLSDSLIRLEEEGYPVVMHVHDEAVVEVPKGFGSVKQVEDLMSASEPWAEGLPVGAEGWRGERYRK